MLCRSLPGAPGCPAAGQTLDLVTSPGNLSALGQLYADVARASPDGIVERVSMAPSVLRPSCPSIEADPEPVDARPGLNHHCVRSSLPSWPKLAGILFRLGVCVFPRLVSGYPSVHDPRLCPQPQLPLTYMKRAARPRFRGTDGTVRPWVCFLWFVVPLDASSILRSADGHFFSRVPPHRVGDLAYLHYRHCFGRLQDLSHRGGKGEVRNPLETDSNDELGSAAYRGRQGGGDGGGLGRPAEAEWTHYHGDYTHRSRRFVPPPPLHASRDLIEHMRI